MKGRNKELKKEPKIEEDLSKKEGKDKGDAAEDKDDVSEEHDWKDTEIGRLCIVVQEDVAIKKEGETLKEETAEADDKVRHHDEKLKHGRLKCEECNTTFRKDISLKSHMAIHTGTKDFVCPVCQKLFKTNPNLVRHQKTHEDVKPYKCNSCDATFSQSSSIKIHVERKHTEHACKLCSEKFQNGPALIRHNIAI